MTCFGEIPKSLKMCPLCGANQNLSEMEVAEMNHQIALKEVNILKRSKYVWERVEDVLMCAGYNDWVIIHQEGDNFIAMGFRKNETGLFHAQEICSSPHKKRCVYESEEWMTKHVGYKNGPLKDAKWIDKAPSEGQLHQLRKHGIDTVHKNNYQAMCWLRMIFNHGMKS